MKTQQTARECVTVMKKPGSKKHLLVIEALKLCLYCFIPLKELKAQSLDRDEPHKQGTRCFIK